MIELEQLVGDLVAIDSINPDPGPERFERRRL
jgi:hypothetical protein